MADGAHAVLGRATPREEAQQVDAESAIHPRTKAPRSAQGTEDIDAHPVRDLVLRQHVQAGAEDPGVARQQRA